MTQVSDTQRVQRIDPSDIASEIIYLSNEDRELRINKLLHEDAKEHVRNWLKDYDADRIDTRKYLEKVHRKLYG